MFQFSSFAGLITAIIFASSVMAWASPVYPSIGLTDIQGMDVYSEGSAIHALLVGKSNQNPSLGVNYLFSTNAGASWHGPFRVNNEADGKVISRRGNEAQIAVSGRNIVAVWRRGGELPESGPLLAAYSRDGGLNWRRGQNLAARDNTQNQSYADVAADRAGNFHAVWLDDREENGNSQGLRYARSSDGGQHWRAEATLDPAVCTCCWNRITVLPGQSLAVMYRDDAPHDMRLALGSSDGRRWRNAGTVGAFDWQFNGCPHCGGGIAAGPGKAGWLHGVVWSGKEAAEGLYYLRSADRGGHWSPPLRIGDGRSRESDIAVLPDGRVGVVFAGPADNREGVQFIESTDAGMTWSTPELLSLADAVVDHPRIVATSAGFRVFWTEKQGAGGRVWAMRLIDQPTKRKP
jgi:hypothetical protein